MRLIDSDALVERINTLYEWCKDERKTGLEQAMCIVQEQPTAYDVEKVVEEFTDNVIDKTGIDYEMDISLDDAIDIVRRGGIDERKN